MEYNFRSLVLWQKARDLSLAIIRTVETLPKNATTDIIARQVVASSASIAANIAEGHGRFSRAAYRNHLSIARGSACETDGWLDLMRGAGYISQETEEELHQRCLELIRLLTSSMKHLQSDQDLPRLREDRQDYFAAEGDIVADSAD